MNAGDGLGAYVWERAAHRLSASAACVLPCGAFEQHGHRLPLATDAIIAERLAQRLVERSAPDIVLSRLPVLAYGCSPEHMEFPGTVSLSRTALCETVLSISRSLASHGVRRLIVLNAHGGNSAALESILREIRQDGGVLPLLFDVYRSAAVQSSAWTMDWHAGAIETSLWLALTDDTDGAVHTIDGRDEKPSKDPDWLQYPGWRIPWTAKELAVHGGIGDPHEATAGEGERLIALLAEEWHRGLLAILQWDEERVA